MMKDPQQPAARGPLASTNDAAPSQPQPATGPRRPTELTLTIDTVNGDGFGTALHNDLPFQVKGALAGESVTARIVRKRRRVRFAEAQEIHRSSADRVASRCPSFPRCGGCVLQHMSDAAALAFKHQSLLTALAAEGVTAQAVAEPVAGPRLHYRRKARLGVKQLGEQVLVGFRESFSARVGRMEHCPILVEPFSSKLAQYAALIAQLSVASRIPQLELAAGDHAQQIILRHLDPLTAADMTALRAFERDNPETLLLQSGGPATVVTLDGQPAPLLHYSLNAFGLSLAFAANEFTQVNARMNARLVSDAMALLRGAAASTVLDLFCGIGNFGLAATREGMRVMGFESVASAVARANANAARNGLGRRCEFQVLDLYDSGAAQLPAADALLLDPPRSGAGPALPQWLRSGVKTGLESVVYVSCNPTSFATDARVLADFGFKLCRVGVYDMFPHTSHVETLGLFRR